ncbi:hypothetical protein [uncultured Roseivirga sp.]|uniref:hypothetical protein n=1 Tax=uncultured Roseivirga sp. TaxID=543088 RepID=UPI0030D8A952|tara:strand:- start:92051 stop:93163 length:1113 start_codon:yes stop_codon:yes gene_type:complete
MERKVVIFDYLVEGKESGHLILDDEYWLNYFSRFEYDFTLYTSSYSRDFQIKRNPNLGNRVKVLMGISIFSSLGSRFHAIGKIIKSPRFYKSKVIIQGFDEVSILVFFLLNAMRKNQFILILTNNISSGRLSKSPSILKALLKIIFYASDIIIFHSEKEKELIEEKFGSRFNEKLRKKKYHLIGRNCKLSAQSKKSNIISFFGPVKKDKPLEPLIDLIRSDSERRFQYNIFNIDKESATLMSEFKYFDHVKISSGFMDDHAYEEAVMRSRYIFLSHNTEFEPKLSGNLCDCFANGIPFISNSIYPAKEFVDAYGPLGFFFDIDRDETWPLKFLTSDSDKIHNDYVGNIGRLQEDYSYSRLVENTRVVLEE